VASPAGATRGRHCTRDVAVRGENQQDVRPLMTYIIAQPCIDTKDGSCVEVCPVDCIYEGEDQFYIHPDECIDCGACEPECPVQAIFPDTDIPAEWTSYLEKNKAHFE